MSLNPKTILGAVLLVAASVLVIWKILPDGPQADPDTPEARPAIISEDRRRPERPVAGETPDSQPGLAEVEEDDPELIDPVVAEAQAAAKQAVLDKIEDAAVTYDPVSLPIIRPYLESPDPELREAAVNAMIVLDDASASPMLREAAANLESIEEAAAMLEAAEFLELPPADLVKMKQRAKEKAAERAAKEAAEAGGAPVRERAPEPEGSPVPDAPSATEE